MTTKLIHMTIDRCNTCPHFRRKGDKLGHGSYKTNVCNLKPDYVPEGNFIVKIPFWCPLPSPAAFPQE